VLPGRRRTGRNADGCASAADRPEAPGPATPVPWSLSSSSCSPSGSSGPGPAVHQLNFNNALLWSGLVTMAAIAYLLATMRAHLFTPVADDRSDEGLGTASGRVAAGISKLIEPWGVGARSDLEPDPAIARPQTSRRATKRRRASQRLPRRRGRTPGTGRTSWPRSRRVPRRSQSTVSSKLLSLSATVATVVLLLLNLSEPTTSKPPGVSPRRCGPGDRRRRCAEALLEESAWSRLATISTVRRVLPSVACHWGSGAVPRRRRGVPKTRVPGVS